MIMSQKMKELVWAGDLIWATTPNIRYFLISTVPGATPEQIVVCDTVAEFLALGFVELSTTNSQRRALASRAVIRLDTPSEGAVRVAADAGNDTIPALGPTSGGPTVYGLAVYLRVGVSDDNDVDWFLGWLDAPNRQVDGEDFPVVFSPFGLFAMASLLT